jgi:putative selenate reductase
MYLSGPPLHVLAMRLVARFRERFGDRYPISFSAGIDQHNFADAVSLGLVPVTSCSDLLKTGGYARPRRYFQRLAERMDAAGARTLDELAVPSIADYVERIMRDPRYHAAQNRKTPRKIGRRLVLFDCITCDKCVPVCPNDANFTFVLERREIPVVKVRREGSAWIAREEGRVAVTEPHQIGNFVDFCNDCGNCDVFCPEDGGPYVLKPRFFSTEAGWRRAAQDGFFMRHDQGRDIVLGRFSGAEYRMEIAGGHVSYSGHGFAVQFDADDPSGTMAGHADADVDLTFFELMDRLRDALFASSAVNYINCLHAPTATDDRHHTL